MADIVLLDNNTIDKIAAGEVVENPASVVKELVENSMDSNSNSITVEIKQGGIEFIRVTDNGSGINRKNIPKAFLRHATSKIKNINDLLLVKSMGFRGEALASIASVSKVELISKPEDELIANRYVIEGGNEILNEEIGAPNGTTIIVRNLFYNTPARRKFLKSETTEASYIFDILQNLALARPDISFNFISNGKTKLSTSGNNDLKEIIYRLYGKTVSDEIIPIEYSEKGISIKGYLGEPSQNRSTRNYESYFINNRLVKSKVISNGIEEAYKAYTMQHKFPLCVLHFSIDCSEVDINVHPSKKEVRFHNQHELEEIISRAVSSTLANHEMIAEVKLESHKNDIPVPEKAPEPFEKRINNVNLPDNEDIKPEPEASDKGYIEDIFTENDLLDDGSFNDHSDKDEDMNFNVNSMSDSAALSSNDSLFKKIVINEPEQMDLFSDDKFLSENSRKEYEIIGQIFNTYWIISFKDKIFFIDQHAAHEKVNYEHLIKQYKNNSVESQFLNPAVIISLSPKDRIILDNNMKYFTNLGFEIDDMGETEIGLRATPMELFFNSPGKIFQEILAELAKYPTKESPDIITGRIATMACKASVKGGMRMSRDEIEALIDELLTLDNPYHCPHGRPTIFSMSKYELEKKFKRVTD